MTAPLAGLKILELGRLMAAPFAAQVLADLGADVIKLERPGSGDESRAYGPPFQEGESYYYLSLNRGKRSIAVDLKTPGGKEVVARLVKASDVLLHNWAADAIARAGLGEAEARALNPRLVYAAVSGFGTDDPRPALDMNAQAASGIMSLTGTAGGEGVRCGVPVSDLVAGLYAAIGILASLQGRERTGKGAGIQTSLLEASASLLTYQASRYFMTGEVPGRRGNAHPSIVPYDGYRTADGAVVIAVANDAAWSRLATVLGLPADPRFADNPGRVRHRTELEPLLAARIATWRTADLVARCRGARVPCDEAASLDRVVADNPDLVSTLHHPRTGEIRTLAPGLKVEGGGAVLPPPRLGEHADEVLAGLGYAAAARESLYASGAVSRPA